MQRSPKTKNIPQKKKTDKVDFVKIKNLFFKRYLKIMKIQYIYLKKDLCPEYKKNYIQLNNKTDNPIK